MRNLCARTAVRVICCGNFCGRGALLAGLIAFSVSALRAADDGALPFLSPVFGNHMVLQREKPNRIWGWTTPGQDVRVEVAGQSAAATAAADGRWQVALQPPPVGGPYVLHVNGPQTAELHDVLVGDVWLCSGQSNMAVGLAGARNGADELKSATHPTIRFFSVPQRAAYTPKLVAQGTWRVCTPENAASGGGVSAVAYYFARRLQLSLPDVPVGLVQAAVGGSPAESWISAEALHATGMFGPPLEEIGRLRARGAPEYGNYIMHWFDEYDAGIRGATWAAPDLDDSAWSPVTIPGGFAELGVGDVPAVCWFRREITLPDPLPAGRARMLIGSVDKMDTTYLNGKWVGASSWVESPRRYNVGEAVPKPGRNVVAIRVFKTKPQPKGGFLASPEAIKLVLGDGTEVPLAGDRWKGRVSVDARPPHPLPLGYENYPTMPVVLYEGMLRSLAPMAICGVLWYQGEANHQRAHQYRRVLPAMIADWRRTFEQGDFPFYIVGLPAFMARRTTPGTDAWTELRDAQDYTARTVSRTGLVITIDTGDAEDLHPPDKQPVGERLALLALADEYHQPVVFSGPTFAAVDRVGDTLRIRFDHVDGGLVVHGDKLREFAIAGADRVWHWAEASIDGASVVVSSPEVREPVAVRYAWQANPDARLFNGAGLPAAPFRTDDWPLSTETAPEW